MVDEPEPNEQSLVYEYQNDRKDVSDQDEGECNPNRHRERRYLCSKGVPARNNEPGTNESGAQVSWVAVIRIRSQGNKRGGGG